MDVDRGSIMDEMEDTQRGLFLTFSLGAEDYAVDGND